MPLTAIVGLALAAAVVARAEPIGELRAWLGGFNYRFNPFPAIGRFLGCPLSVGFVVGAVPGASGGVLDAIILGGEVAGLAFVASSLITIVGWWTPAEEKNIDDDVAQAVPLVVAQLEAMGKIKHGGDDE